MKQIKFRAWDNDNKKMVENVCVFNGIAYPTPLKDSIGTKVMQFTGFIDKNGKEVYEGDIVQYKFEFPRGSKHERIYNIEFDGCSFRAKGCVLSIYEKEKIEVIANIYENPNNIEYER